MPSGLRILFRIRLVPPTRGFEIPNAGWRHLISLILTVPLWCPSTSRLLVRETSC